MKRVVIVFLFMECVSITHAQLLGKTDFESHPYGTAFTKDLWQLEGFETETWDNGLAERTMIDTTTAALGKKSLRVTYPKETYGPKPNGCQIALIFAPSNELYLSYWVKFSDNFSWGTTNQGGILPGLAGGKRCSGGETCDGTNGFSARFMWRTNGKAVLYLYHMDKPSMYGEDFDLLYASGNNVLFERGKWYHLMERVKINTNTTTYDGEVEVWVNGERVLLKNGLRFTSNGDKVDDLYFSTFHGGNDITWVPTTTCYTWFDDIRVSTQKKDVE